MPIPSADIQKLYIAFFNRPADVGGLTFWSAQGDIDAVARAMFGSPEFRAVHAGMDNAAIVASLYQNLFGRAPDDGGLAFWRDALDRGVLNTASLAVELIRVTHGNDGATLANKATVAAEFTTALDTPAEQAIYEANLGASSVKSLLNGVRADDASLQAAQGSVASTIIGLFPVTPPVMPPVVTPPTPVTFTLTVAIDDKFKGGAGDDTVIGTSDTLQSTDVLDGGAGVDTLSLTLRDPVVPLNPVNIRNFERLSISATQVVAIDFNGLAGITELVNDHSTGASLEFGLAGQAAAAVPTLARLTLAGGTSATAVHFARTALIGNTDDMKVVLSDTGATLRSLSLRTTNGSTNQLESVSFDVSGMNVLNLSTDLTQTTLQTLNISGSGALALQIDTAWTMQQIRTINAGTATGNITLGTAAAPLMAATTSVRLGSGNDLLYFGSNLADGATIDGGAGTDTLVVTSMITAAQAAGLSNIDVVRIDATGTSINQSTDLSSLTGVDYEVLGVNGVVILDRLANDKTVSVVGSLTTLRPQLLRDTANDVLTVKLGGGVTLSTLYATAGLDTLNLVSTGTSMITTDQVTAKHVITGSGTLTFTNPLAAIDIDASGFTGTLSLTLSYANGGPVNTFIGGTGADTLVSGLSATTYHLSKPGTSLPTGADRISLGGGDATIVFSGINAGGDGAGAASSLTPFARMYYFEPQRDRLAFSASDDAFKLGGFAGLAKGATAQGLTVGDTIVTQRADTGGNIAAAADVSFFKFTGFASSNGNIAAMFADAIGNSTVSGLAVNGNYLVGIYGGRNDTVIGMVNVGADGVLSRADMTTATVAIVGVLDSGGSATLAALNSTNLIAVA